MTGSIDPPFRFDRVLVFCAHPDDEVLGCGGTLARLGDAGADIHVVVFSIGGVTRTSDLTGEQHDLRQNETTASHDLLGVTSRDALGLASQDIANTKELFRYCTKTIRQFKPDVIFTHHGDDKHRDHRAIADMVDEARWKASENCMADLGPTHETPLLYYFEVFDMLAQPSLIVDITATLGRKLEAMKAHQSQIDMYPDVLGYIEGLAKARSFLLNGGYAEAFVASRRMPTLWR